ncbi:Protein N-acetyltransferase, RimJ/RimL family [Georgenia satyanarayanai]|uniref:Protein N-acetyltransferase, RimJ/RimL family n=1 Tax=Georgenia satyanarayanai TaxID=860221 RepID=A0A2Y9AM44_9MICO|nr:GNAT family protein [Georgenia satyanarayanai]PYF98340.1 RimJ/RimL family protein N-acetyltransferase [Georgenia satyanarayanai]SSA45225.1 Protein N-acetyltransferase, RimJ/RimL family [Georgenia satyanarayanai]
MIPVVGTPVKLRRLEREDLEALHAYKNDPDARSLLVGFSTGYSRTDLVDWLEYHRTRNDEVLFAIASVNNDECLGHVGLYEIDYRTRKAQFGILIGAPGARNKGWGTAISRTMLDFGFGELNLNKITGQYLTSNVRVRHMNLKLGFEDEGVLRDEVFRGGRYHDIGIMSVLRRNWEPLAEHTGEGEPSASHT